VFKYLDDAWHCISSEHVDAYLHETAGRPVTAELRTGASSVLIAQRALKRSREIDARQCATRRDAGESRTLPQVDVPGRQG
jgi:hypothetical protein